MKKVYLLMLLILLSIATAQSPIYSESLLLDINMNSDFDLVFRETDSRADFVKARFQYIPIENYNQEIVSLETQPEAQINEENILFEWKNPSENQYELNVKSRVRTYNKFKPIYSKVDFPVREVAPELQEYLDETEKIVIDENILRQANEIAKGENDLFIVVLNLATWTKDNINYSLNSFTETASQDSSWVLENRYGVCDELTNLFIAMNRALGIPARFISGLSYTDSELFDEEWGLHGWAEVYFPGYGWVPFDPTYGQYGYVDATHVKLSESVDSDKSSTSFEWQGINVDLTPGSLVNTVNIIEQEEKMKNPVSLDVDIHSNKVDLGSYNLIKVKIKNNQNHYVGLELRLNKPVELSIENDPVKYVSLKPKEEKKIYWLVKLDDNLQKNYIYTFRINVESSMGYSEDDVFTSEFGAIEYNYRNMELLMEQLIEQEEKVYSKNLDLDCSVPSTIYSNETFTIKCKVSNEGNVFLHNLKVCLQECQAVDLGISQSENVEFSKLIKESGEKEINIRARNLDVSSFQNLRVTVFDKPKISLEKIQYPKKISYGPDFSINFEIWKHSLSSPENLTVKFVFNNKETTWDIDELDSNQGFKVDLDKTSLDPDENSFSIIVNYHDSNNRVYTKHYKQNIKLDNIGFFTKVLMWLNKWSRDVENIILERNI